MSEKHTPEPWKLEGYSIHGNNEEYIVYLEDCSSENARRIVACVNALEGIPTEILEMAGTGLMSEAAVEVGKLTAQRDELLAALRGVKRGSCFCEVSCDNPMMGGKHTKECLFAISVLNRHDVG